MKLIPFLVALTGLSLSFSVMADTTSAAGTEPMASDTMVSDSAAAAPEETTSSEAANAGATEPADSQSATADSNSEPMTEQAGFSRGSVVRSIFTSSVQDREPIDKLNTKTEAEQIYYFTELRDMSGQTATHRWEYDGRVVAEVKFDVRGPRWRVWSSKSFTPTSAGDWKVSVINGAGETISEEMITMSSIPAGAAEAMPSATDTPATEPMATDADSATEPAAEEFQPPVTDQLLQ